MAVEDDTNTADKPADDIRSVLAAAIATHEPEFSPEKPAKAADESEPAKAGEGDDVAKPPAKRGPDGKFTKSEADSKDGEADAPVEKTEAEDKAAAEKTAEDKPDDKSESEKAEAALTGKWSAKDKETYKALPQEGKDLFLRRHKEMEGAFTRKTQEIAAFRREYEPVDKIFDPYRDKMKAAGWTPQSLIQGWANVEKRLMDGDGVGVIAGLVQGYKINLGKVAQALGLRPREAAQSQDGDQPAAVQNGDGRHIELPPELIQQLQSLQQRLDAQDHEKADNARRAQQGEVQRVMSDIEKFKSAQDDKGKPLHPHFDDLEEDMTSLAAAAIAAKKPVPSLQDLYEKAVWANPSTRDAEIAARGRAQQEKASQEARAKAAAAKKASSSVTGAPGSGQAVRTSKSSDLSLREQLEQAAEDAA